MTLAYSFVVSVIIAKVIDRTMGLRVTEAQEEEGLDLSQHARPRTRASERTRSKRNGRRPPA